MSLTSGSVKWAWSRFWFSIGSTLGWSCHQGGVWAPECCHPHCGCPPLCVSHPEEGKAGTAVPLQPRAQREADFRVSFPKKLHFLSPQYSFSPCSSLTLSQEKEKTDRKKRKERNLLPGLEKSSFPRSSVITLMEGRTGKRKCFANVENFWPGFFLRPVCQGEKEIGGWMKYELMQLQCL